MKKILVIAGEPSGDKHGASLLKEIKKILPDACFAGIGGDLMAAEGMTILEHNKNMAFMGLVEVLIHLKFISSKIRQIKKYIDTENPAAVILIDYPGFNLKIAAYAKKKNIPVAYYICPQVWAWGQHRVKKIKEIVDLPLSILPFEEEFYRRHGVNAIFVGHPSLESSSPLFSENDFRKEFAIKADELLIGLLPGSRQMEIESLLPEMLRASAMLYEKYPNIRFLLSIADNLDDEIFKPYLHNVNIPVTLVKGYPYDVMRHSRLVVVASGTAALETAANGTPAIVLYKVNPLTFFIGKMVVKIPYISLPNLILNKEIFPELLQDECNSEMIYLKLVERLENEQLYKQIVDGIAGIKEKLDKGKTSENAAKEIVKLLHN